MRHLYRCPVRWADLDPYAHVNNVIYVDYLQEARIDMIQTHAPDSRSSDLAEGLVVVRHEVTYAAPLAFRAGSVSIECWVTEIRAASFTMAYEIFDENADGRTVYLRAKTVLAPFVFAEERPRRLHAQEKEVLQPFVEPDVFAPFHAIEAPRESELGQYALHVRWSDVDAYRHVNNVKYFEYFQEARVNLLYGLADRQAIGGRPALVVAQTDVEYRYPILFRGAPYRIVTGVSRVGESSFTLVSEIRDEEQVLSRSRVTMVHFDPATQRATPAPAAYREALASLLPATDQSG